jgi:hypothetical protein
MIVNVTLDVMSKLEPVQEVADREEEGIGGGRQV